MKIAFTDLSTGSTICGKDRYLGRRRPRSNRNARSTRAGNRRVAQRSDPGARKLRRLQDVRLTTLLMKQADQIDALETEG